MSLKTGVYEKIVDQITNTELNQLPAARKYVQPLDDAEASKILTQYLSGLIKSELDSYADNDLDGKVQFSNKIIDLLQNTQNDNNKVVEDASKKPVQLLTLLPHQHPLLSVGKKAEDFPRPDTSLSQSSLFTGAEYEPQMYLELKREILSCDRIDMLVSFIKWSGLRLLMDELIKFTQNGGKLRILTTSYMGATDPKAIDELSKLINTEIKVSYDTKRTRLHAKAYIFRRDTGYTTAYVGSSNLSNVAISTGLEWNIKTTAKDLPETLAKITSTFESYWNSSEFELYTIDEKGRLNSAIRSARNYGRDNSLTYVADVKPYSYQQEILDNLQTEREVRGYYKNLVVAATGTGKTVISAFDYKRFTKQRENIGHPCRLLFIAHREEILRQSLATFRAVLKDGNFGDLFVGNYTPAENEHLFMSIQTFNSQDFTNKTSPDYYDFIIVDEFHHAAAPSYDKLLAYYKPKILLGLTATPERMDGKSILKFFDDRIAAEIRLSEAIDRKLLSPFQYFGVTDNVDLSNLRWVAGGYDKNALSDAYVSDSVKANERADLVIRSLDKYVTDMAEVKGLGFCVSVAHAEFMANYFNDHSIPSLCLTAAANDEARNSAKAKLVNGDYKFIFVVDLYNEGVDIPEVNTVLFLRPTESLTVFLQQLGRGLRLADGKECLTVLDFIGQANRKYNFESKFAALLKNKRKPVSEHVKHGFGDLPKGCYINLERKAQEYILENIEQSLHARNAYVNKIATFKEDSGQDPTLTNFVNYYGLDPVVLYRRNTFSRMLVEAGIRSDFQEPAEESLKKGLAGLTKIDSRRWITFLQFVLPQIKHVRYSDLDGYQKRMMKMFYVTVWKKVTVTFQEDDFLKDMKDLGNSPILVDEILELLQLKYDQIDFVDKSVDVGFDCPLDLHCTYSRDQILVAFDFNSPNSVREGVKWLPDKKVDIFFVTLNKTEKDYSPSTMYEDYSVSEELFHWQSQNATAEGTDTGDRYIHHVEQGSRVVLFVREFKKDLYGNTAYYVYYGTMTYVEHKGSKPMSILWKLDMPVLAKYLKISSKLIGG